MAGWGTDVYLVFLQVSVNVGLTDIRICGHKTITRETGTGNSGLDGHWQACLLKHPNPSMYQPFPRSNPTHHLHPAPISHTQSGIDRTSLRPAITPINGNLAGRDPGSSRQPVENALRAGLSITQADMVSKEVNELSQIMVSGHYLEGIHRSKTMLQHKINKLSADVSLHEKENADYQPKSIHHLLSTMTYNVESSPRLLVILLTIDSKMSISQTVLVSRSVHATESSSLTGAMRRVKLEDVWKVTLPHNLQVRSITKELILQLASLSVDSSVDISTFKDTVGPPIQFTIGDFIEEAGPVSNRLIWLIEQFTMHLFTTLAGDGSIYMNQSDKLKKSQLSIRHGISIDKTMQGNQKVYAGWTDETEDNVFHLVLLKVGPV